MNADDESVTWITRAKMITPSEPGLYWARSDDGFAWYNLIVQVVGEAPWLRIKNVSIFSETLIPWSRVEPFLPTPEEVIFGPKIDIPEVSNTK